MKLTNATIVGLPAPPSGYRLYWDNKLAGFGVRVTNTGHKAFIYQKSIGGKDRRVTIGPCDGMTSEQARRKAEGLLAKFLADAGGGILIGV